MYFFFISQLIIHGYHFLISIYRYNIIQIRINVNKNIQKCRRKERAEIYELKELIKIVSKLEKEEWESFKSYVDHKFKTVGVIKNDALTYETLETFLLKVRKVN